MRRPRRLLIAVALLAGGTGVALVSRRHVEKPAPQASTYFEPSKSRAQLPVDLPDEGCQPAHLSGTIEADPEVSPDAETASAAPGQNGMPFQTQPGPMDADWRPSMRTASYQSAAVPPPPSPHEPPKPKIDRKVSFVLHTIVDGDTLSSLAQRYLGSGKRFNVIFEANRDRLETPDLLPIGTELRIPVEKAGE